MPVSLPVANIPQPYAMLETAEAIRQSALLVQATWIVMAQSGQHVVRAATGSYVRGLQTAASLVYPAGGGSLSAEVVNVAPHAQALEQGHTGYHLPSVINWATAAAKTSKAGVRYMAIPFRHRAPGRAGGGQTAASQSAAMPQQIYNAAKRLRPGQRLTAGPSGGRRVHGPGMTPYQPAYAPNVRLGYTHASIYEGMTKQGAAGHSQYMTFRMMTEHSTGWHIPPRAGIHLAQKVAAATSTQVSQMVSDAVARDVLAYAQRMLGGTP